MNMLFDLLPILIPIIMIQLGLQIFAIYHLMRREAVRFDHKWIWLIIIIALTILGPIIYFLFSEEA
ncbi:phospholipase D-like protein [Natranaerovirga hydrolytica]|uniref:Phospholipase D-like protein n=1 Tax=Natranaerovirga hydrolytica TaxID=680378 RepID=A0A4V2PZP6_9FIRM|nr:PLDc N-terminal domain-containing protein [Natranaerovirga hydrolytica]TCK90611.1 phospholipase D-like protein [Natranaerovirga hydrolytica]